MGLILSPRLNLHDPYGPPQENLAQLAMQLVRSNAKSLPKFVTVNPRKVSWLVAYASVGWRQHQRASSAPSF